MNENLDLDRPLWGVAEIGREAGLFKKDEKGRTVIGKDGEPAVDTRKAFRLVEQGHIAATKKGNLLVSTPRRVRESLATDSPALKRTTPPPGQPRRAKKLKLVPRGGAV
jgi:hypothetical protein